VYPGVANRDVDLGVAEVTNEAFATSVEKWFRVLWLRPCFEDFLVVENDGTVCGRKIFALFLFIALRLVLGLFVLVDGFEFEASNLMNLDAENTGGIVLGRWRSNYELVFASLIN